MNFNDDEFRDVLGKLIKFRTGTTKTPIKNSSWEELIWAA